MIMSVAHVYNIPQVVILSTGTGAQNMNFPVTRSDILILKGVKNTIDFYIKDIDRKPVVIDGSLMMRVITRDTRKVALALTLTLVDPVKAHYQAKLAARDVVDLPFGYLDYNVTVLDVGGGESPLFNDRDRQDLGTVEVKAGGAFGAGAGGPDAVVITHDDLLPRDGYWYSSALPGSAQVGNLSGTSTYVVFGNHFTGNVAVQGMLDSMPSVYDSDWLTIESHDQKDLTGNIGYTFQGNYYWIRFRIGDQTDPNAGDDGDCGCLPQTNCTPVKSHCAPCLPCNGNATVDQGALITPIDWPEGTPLGIVRIQFRA